MINKILLKIFFIFIIFNNYSYANLKQKNFEFEVSEIEIKNEGNIIIGNNRGLISSNNEIFIEADTFKYNRVLNILELFGNITIKDEIKNIKILSEHIQYNKNLETINSFGETKVIIEEKYNLKTKNLFFDRDKLILSSPDKSSIYDNNNNYFEFINFKYLINDQILKANNVYLESGIITSENDVNKNKFYFENGIFDLKS